MTVASPDYSGSALLRALKPAVARFSERGAQLARRDEGAGRRPVTEEATPPDGMPRPKTWPLARPTGGERLDRDGAYLRRDDPLVSSVELEVQANTDPAELQTAAAKT